MAKPLELTDANFDQEVLKVQGCTIVDFWAEWCGPCRMIAPIVEELATEYDGKLKVGKLNVDDNPNTAVKFGVRSIPMLLLFKNGELKDQIIGALPKEAIKKKVNELIGQAA